jgi:glycine/D-amino acid oxidase-like deaminating enzyme
MGGITQAMANFARSKGVDIRTAAPVEKILVEKGRAVGVQLESGEILNSRCVLANTDPKRTFLKLLDPDQLDLEFVKDIRVSSQTRLLQAEIAEATGRSLPAENFKRAAELCCLPDEKVLKPGDEMVPVDKDISLEKLTVDKKYTFRGNIAKHIFGTA